MITITKLHSKNILYLLLKIIEISYLRLNGSEFPIYGTRQERVHMDGEFLGDRFGTYS